MLPLLAVVDILVNLTSLNFHLWPLWWDLSPLSFFLHFACDCFAEASTQWSLQISWPRWRHAHARRQLSPPSPQPSYMLVLLRSISSVLQHSHIRETCVARPSNSTPRPSPFFSAGRECCALLSTSPKYIWLSLVAPCVCYSFLCLFVDWAAAHMWWRVSFEHRTSRPRGHPAKLVRTTRVFHVIFLRIRLCKSITRPVHVVFDGPRGLFFRWKNLCFAEHLFNGITAIVDYLKDKLMGV